MKQRRDTSKKSINRRHKPSAAEPTIDDFSVPQRFVAPGPLVAQNASQDRYIRAIKSFPLVFGTGPAGTGKTYIAGALAAQALLDGEVDKIIITRPAVEAGESLGFLPGEIEEKYEPYIAAFRSVLIERLGKTRVEYMLKAGQLEAIPLAYMRGLTFKRAFVIMDEAQNATRVQMKLFLTRIGQDSTVVVNGDIEQKDIAGESGLEDAANRLATLPKVRVVRFSDADVVRSDLCQQIVRAYAQ